MGGIGFVKPLRTFFLCFSFPRQVPFYRIGTAGISILKRSMIFMELPNAANPRVEALLKRRFLISSGCFFFKAGKRADVWL
jgi:hypothetical protein